MAFAFDCAMTHTPGYKYVSSEISDETKNSTTTDHCTARAIALGTSVIVSATLNPSVEQITPASRPGTSDLAMTLNTSQGPIARATLSRNPKMPPVRAPSSQPNQ